MSDLVVVAYENETTAEQAKQRLLDLQKQNLITLDDVVVVRRRKSDGKVNIEQSKDLAGAGALSGGFWGMLIGLIFFVPVLGLAVGAITGALAGKSADIGINDNFIKDVGSTIQPGNSALFILIRRATPDKVIEAMKEYKGKVIRTSLTEQQEAKLRETFGEAGKQAQQPQPAGV